MTQELVPYILRPGETLDQLSRLRGFNPEQIWSLERNRRVRTHYSHWRELRSGDRIFIPSLRSQVVGVLQPGNTHRFEGNSLGPGQQLQRLEIVDLDQTPPSVITGTLVKTVGQRVNLGLHANVQGATISDIRWHIPGNVVRDYL